MAIDWTQNKPERGRAQPTSEGKFGFVKCDKFHPQFETLKGRRFNFCCRKILHRGLHRNMLGDEWHEDDTESVNRKDKKR